MEGGDEEHQLSAAVEFAVPLHLFGCGANDFIVSVKTAPQIKRSGRGVDALIDR